MREITRAATRRRGRPRLIFFDQRPQALSRDPDISIGAKSLYGLLHGYCPRKRLQDRPECVVTKETLARGLDKLVDRIDAYVNELRSGGWIGFRRQGRMQSNIYTLYSAPKKKMVVARKSDCQHPVIHDRGYDPFCRERYRRELAANYGDNGSKITESEVIAFLGPPPDIEDLPWPDEKLFWKSRFFVSLVVH